MTTREIIVELTIHSVVRDRTVGQWKSAVAHPETISPEMIAALKQRGYTPPATMQRRSSPAEMATQPHNGAISKAVALDSITKGDPIPPSILRTMKASGWTGPGLARRDFSFEEEIYARDFDGMYELFGRDVEAEVYARDIESAEILARDAEADPEAEAYFDSDSELYSYEYGVSSM